MKYAYNLIVFCCFLSTSYAQNALNTSLKKELDSILVEDQKYRTILSMDMNTKSDSLANAFQVSKEELINHLWHKQSHIDSLNQIRIEQIIERYGYPGKTLVGTPTNEAAFYVLQHSKVIDKYLPLVEKAAEKGELKFSLYAMMLDRHLMFQGKEQVYGTQGSGFTITNAQGERELLMIIWPIKDEPGVNERRKKAGFALSVEDNAKRLGIPYKVYTIEEVNKLKSTINN